MSALPPKADIATVVVLNGFWGGPHGTISDVTSFEAVKSEKPRPVD